MVHQFVLWVANCHGLKTTVLLDQRFRGGTREEKGWETPALDDVKSIAS